MIIRVEHRRRYTCVSNDTLEDARLSFRAIGLLVFLLSKPDGWNTRIGVLYKTHAEGREATRSAMHELEALGYAQRLRLHDPDTGGLRWETVIYEQPSAQKSTTIAQEPVTQEPVTQEPVSQVVSTEEASTELVKPSLRSGAGPLVSVPCLDALGSDARGQRLPQFVLSPAMYEWAAENAPNVDIRTESAVFADYWRGVSGQKARKADWLATWRNWMRRANDETRTNGRARAPTKTQAVIDRHPEVARLLKENL